MFEVYADYHTLYELWKVLPDSDLRTMKIGEALQQFTYTADFEAEEPERSESILKGAKLLQPLLEKKNGDTVPEYTVFGQSHSTAIGAVVDGLPAGIKIDFDRVAAFMARRAPSFSASTRILRNL